MFVDEPAGCRRLGRVGDDRGEGVAQLVAYLVEVRSAAGDADDVGTASRQSRGDAPAESAAGSGDDRRCADEFVLVHGVS